MATTADGVYAAGDVTGLFPHSHAPHAMGRVAVGAALRRSRRPFFDATAIPRVVFTDPEIATVGAPNTTTGVHGWRSCRCRRSIP
ncbi:MAG: hypothetical protein ACRDSE_22835 [Pseudonocardiaceae bacterium]